MTKENELYKTVYSYFKSGRQTTVDKNLTLEDAKMAVKQDKIDNPNTNTKMLIFTKM